MKNDLILKESIENKIFVLRGQKIMLDKDLAELYGVKTKVLNQAVKRNIKRFPKDFMKHSTSSPYAFTKQGVAILSSDLNSEQFITLYISA